MDSVRTLVTALLKGIGQCAQSLGTLYVNSVALRRESLLLLLSCPPGLSLPYGRCPWIQHPCLGRTRSLYFAMPLSRSGMRLSCLARLHSLPV